MRLGWGAVKKFDLKNRKIEVADFGAAEETLLEEITSAVLLSRDILDALILDLRNRRATRANDLLHRGEHPERIAEILQVGVATVYNLQKRYLEEGLEAALSEKPRSGKPPVISGEAKAGITALACSEAPEGHARWTLRLLADKAVEFGIVDSISYKTCGEILKKTNFDRI